MLGDKGEVSDAVAVASGAAWCCAVLTGAPGTSSAIPPAAASAALHAAKCQPWSCSRGGLGEAGVWRLKRLRQQLIRPRRLSLFAVETCDTRPGNRCA